MQALNVTSSIVTIGYMGKSEELQRFAQRLNEICDDKGVAPKYQGRQPELANIFGVSQKGARKWLEAESWPSLETLVRIRDWSGVNFEWLVHGNGPKYPSELYPTPEIARVVERMRVMEPAAQSLAARLIDQLEPPPSEERRHQPERRAESIAPQVERRSGQDRRKSAVWIDVGGPGNPRPPTPNHNKKKELGKP